ILFAASGFLLVGGPAALSSLHERWRLFWLFGEGNPVAGLDDAFQVWLFLALLYFLLVVARSACVLYNPPPITCLYNTDPPAPHSPASIPPPPPWSRACSSRYANRSA